MDSEIIEDVEMVENNTQETKFQSPFIDNLARQ
jgi:hypothetical protein